MAQPVDTYFGGRLIFNPEAWTDYAQKMPRVKTYNFINSGVVMRNNDITEAFGKQTGSFSQRMPMFGDAKAKVVNYDGKTPMPKGEKQDSYSMAVVAYGRQFSLGEDDFSYDLIPGQDFGANLRAQIGINRDNQFEERILGLTKTLFSFANDESPEGNFAKTHTYNISVAPEQPTASSKIGATTLNNAIQQASREFKSDYTMVAMNSQVATNLENLKLIEYAKGVDADGVVKDLGFYTWNGRTVVIDDTLTVDEDGNYVTYIYGKGMFAYSDLPVRVPYEMFRDQREGVEEMFVRYREVVAPRGFSFEGKIGSYSPTDAELNNPANWKLADNGKESGERKTYPIERIPLARIVSQG